MLIPLDSHEDEGQSALFSDLFTPPAGQVATIQLVAVDQDGDHVVDSLSPGVHPPTVSIQQPAGGSVVSDSLKIQWTASDPDPDDRLLFTVQYSHNNGASWHTLAINVPSTPDPSNLLTFNDLGSLHGSGPNTALIRVLATDGYNTKIAISQPFTLTNRPPQPAIITPGAGQTFAAGDDVLLRGTATDPEDGGLAGNALRWQVDGSDAGQDTDVTVPGLATGPHTAALAATDSNSQTITATVSFHVAPLSILQIISPTVAFDGFCDDAPYMQAADLQLQPYSDGSQATVRLLAR